MYSRLVQKFISSRFMQFRIQKRSRDLTSEALQVPGFGIQNQKSDTQITQKPFQILSFKIIRSHHHHHQKIHWDSEFRENTESCLKFLASEPSEAQDSPTTSLERIQKRSRILLEVIIRRQLLLRSGAL